MKTFDLLIKDITASLNFREDDIFIEARQKLKRTALSISPISFSLYKKSIDDVASILINFTLETGVSTGFAKLGGTAAKFFAIGFGVLSLFNLTDIDGDLAILIGGAVIVLPILIILGIRAIFKKCKKGKSKNERASI